MKNQKRVYLSPTQMRYENAKLYRDGQLQFQKPKGDNIDAEMVGNTSVNSNVILGSHGHRDSLTPFQAQNNLSLFARSIGQQPEGVND